MSASITRNHELINKREFDFLIIIVSSLAEFLALREVVVARKRNSAIKSAVIDCRKNIQTNQPVSQMC